MLQAVGDAGAIDALAECFDVPDLCTLFFVDCCNAANNV